MKHKKSFYIAVTIGVLIIIVEAAVLLKTMWPKEQVSGDRVEDEQEWDWSAMAEGAEEQFSMLPEIGDTEAEVSGGESETETPDAEVPLEKSGFDALTENQIGFWARLEMMMNSSQEEILEKHPDLYLKEDSSLGDYNTGNYQIYASDNLEEGIYAKKFDISPTYGVGLYSYTILYDMAKVEEELAELNEVYGAHTDFHQDPFDEAYYTYIWHYPEIDATIWARVDEPNGMLTVSIFNDDFNNYGEYMLLQ